jgi:Pyruvate/2-oxoacid:ferredoxin oxidoreductase delta subunit
LSDEIPAGDNPTAACLWQCGVCSAVCADRAIAYRPGGLVVDRSRCSGCLICVRVCPAGILEEKTFG